LRIGGENIVISLTYVFPFKKLASSECLSGHLCQLPDKSSRVQPSEVASSQQCIVQHK
jgi:hypothetical protein